MKTMLYATKNDLVAVHKSKVILILNKTADVGMCRLASSKLLMFEFHHGYIRNKCSNISRLLFTDTDRLIYEIKGEDVYEDFSNIFFN